MTGLALILLIFMVCAAIAIAAYGIGRADEMLHPDDDRFFVGLRRKRDPDE